jgi:hypothetical protein
MITEEVARAFTVLAMPLDKIPEVREVESHLPPNLCLSSSQIAHAFLNNERPMPQEAEIHAMNSLWLDFYTKILYPQQQSEEALHPAGCTMFTCTHPWDDRCKTKAQEMWQWEDYAIARYHGPAPAHSLDAQIGLV